MHSCQLFLISSVSVRSVLFMCFIVGIFAWNIPLVSLIFLKRSLVFPSLLFSSISLHCSFMKSFFTLLALLWRSVFRWVHFPFLLCLLLHLFAQLSVKLPQKTSFHSGISFFLGMVLIMSSAQWLWTSIHSSSGILSDLIPWVYISISVYNHKGFDLGHNWMA